MVYQLSPLGTTAHMPIKNLGQLFVPPEEPPPLITSKRHPAPPEAAPNSRRKFHRPASSIQVVKKRVPITHYHYDPENNQEEIETTVLDTISMDFEGDSGRKIHLPPEEYDLYVQSIIELSINGVFTAFALLMIFA